MRFQAEGPKIDTSMATKIAADLIRTQRVAHERAIADVMARTQLVQLRMARLTREADEQEGLGL